MTDYERIKYYFNKGWAKIVQVRQYVGYGKITPEQFTEITGETY